MALFHYQICMPSELKTPIFKGELKYTRHAQEAAQTDRYGLISLPKEVNFDNGLLIEAEAIKEASGKLFCFKQVWRVQYDETRDLCLVVTNEGAVKTVWINERNDSHRTLKRYLYARSIKEA